MQTDIEAALSFMAAEAESNAVLMQQAVTDAVCTDLKGRIKKEVEKVVDKAKGSFTPALQAVCVELEDRLKQVSFPALLLAWVVCTARNTPRFSLCAHPPPPHRRGNAMPPYSPHRSHRHAPWVGVK